MSFFIPACRATRKTPLPGTGKKTCSCEIHQTEVRHPRLLRQRGGGQGKTGKKHPRVLQQRTEQKQVTDGDAKNLQLPVFPEKKAYQSKQKKNYNLTDGLFSPAPSFPAPEQSPGQSVKSGHPGIESWSAIAATSGRYQLKLVRGQIALTTRL